MNPEVLQILRCPEDGSALSAASEELIAKINSGIQQGGVRNAGGMTVTNVLHGGLVRSQGDLLYPIVDGIPLLLRDEAIATKLGD